MFPNNEDVDTVVAQLNSAGFPVEDYHISRISTASIDHSTTTQLNYKEDEKTSGFWNWLFGDNDDERERYSYAGSKSNIVTVYTDEIDRAEKAREIMNNEGAINVNEFTKDGYTNSDNSSGSADLTEKERARIINKAKNNLYFTDGNRFYDVDRSGMESDMDSDGTGNAL